MMEERRRGEDAKGEEREGGGTGEKLKVARGKGSKKCKGKKQVACVASHKSLREHISLIRTLAEF